MGYWINNAKSVEEKLKFRHPDHIMFWVVLSVFILLNLSFIIWIRIVAYRPRRLLEHQTPWIVVDKQHSSSL